MQLLVLDPFEVPRYSSKKEVTQVLEIFSVSFRFGELVSSELELLCPYFSFGRKVNLMSLTNKG